MLIVSSPAEMAPAKALTGAEWKALISCAKLSVL